MGLFSACLSQENHCPVRHPQHLISDGVCTPLPWEKPPRTLLLEGPFGLQPPRLNLIAACTWPLKGECHRCPKGKEDGPRAAWRAGAQRFPCLLLVLGEPWG